MAFCVLREVKKATKPVAFISLQITLILNSGGFMQSFCNCMGNFLLLFAEQAVDF
jgi:hypothetical protein